jgi:hypothetical protein
MTDLVIAPDFIYDVNKLLVDTFYNRRYKINPRHASNHLIIDFEGYFVENYKLTTEDIDNPDLSDDFYRDERIDFGIKYQGAKNSDYKLSICGYWRTEVLSFEYTPEKSIWLNESYEKIEPPCSDADEFESMAPLLYDYIEMYFKSEIEMGLFTVKE